jgi:hypothetical protein
VARGAHAGEDLLALLRIPLQPRGGGVGVDHLLAVGVDGVDEQLAGTLANGCGAAGQQPLATRGVEIAGSHLLVLHRGQHVGSPLRPREKRVQHLLSKAGRVRLPPRQQQRRDALAAAS